ncbi:MAG: hypothetical protein EOO62_32325 [Hymenobacter sp.]|nr:MAG: hypothetical protein EOO62_32325 [Hymenobacter sp.]
MKHSLRRIVVLANTLAALAACQRTTDEVNPTLPITLLGEWRLAVAGGGITGVMSPVPAGDEQHLVFRSDSTYAYYDNGTLRETNTFGLRSQPAYPGGPAQQELLLKTTNSPGGQPYNRSYCITLLAASNLNFTTGGGCALNAEYVRVATGSLPTAKQ